MKQVLITVGILLLAMVGYYWVSAGNLTKNIEQKTGTEVKTEEESKSDKQIFFVNEGDFLHDQENIVKMMVRENNEKVVGYWVEINYDPTMMEIKNVEVNKDIFDKKAEVKIDATSGNIKIVAQNSKNRDKLVTGEILLANIQVKNLKAGKTIFYLSRKPEVDILVKGKVVESYLEMPNFKINIL